MNNLNDEGKFVYKGIYWCGDCSYFDFHTGMCEQGCNLKDNNRSKDSHFPNDCPLPDVMVVKHGHWTRINIVGKEYGKVYYQHVGCSRFIYESPYHFCPLCGAKMDEEEIDK